MKIVDPTHLGSAPFGGHNERRVTSITKSPFHMADRPRFNYRPAPDGTMPEAPKVQQVVVLPALPTA